MDEEVHDLDDLLRIERLRESEKAPKTQVQTESIVHSLYSITVIM